MASLEICYLTDSGGRNTNEDELLIKSVEQLHILAVADGIGGCAAGEVASSVALTEIEKSLEANLEEGDIGNVVKEAVAKANKEIYLLSKENPEYAGMGTTLVMALIQQGKVVIANVGDSRAYHLSGGQIRQISRDHSVVQVLIERGMITEEEARHHPQRNSLTRALGAEPQVEVDLYNTKLKRGDILMLCSDGLTDSLSDEEINEVVRSASNMDKACAELIRRANEKGGKDNITVVLAREKRNERTVKS